MILKRPNIYSYSILNISFILNTYFWWGGNQGIDEELHCCLKGYKSSIGYDVLDNSESARFVALDSDGFLALLSFDAQDLSPQPVILKHWMMIKRNKMQTEINETGNRNKWI